MSSVVAAGGPGGSDYEVKATEMSSITENDVEHWRQHGYVIVQLLTDDEVCAAVDNINEYLPTWDEYVRRPRWFRETIASPVRGPGQAAEFPYAGTAINKTTIHPDFIAFAERVMGTDRLMLSHGQLGGKYAGTRDFEQELHRDYGNNTLVVPPPDSEIIDLPMIVYYTDVTIDLSPTYVVSQELTRDLPPTPRNLSRANHPEYYAQEVPVTVPAGAAVIYSMNTFHRGSALRASEGLRYAQNIGLKRTDAPWSGQVTFQHEGGRPEMDAFLENASPRERELVGFPRVGDPYWNKVTIDGVEGRYPGMDMAPYRAAL
jgi:ectoine hydroxylase-related dioxygenase (phytanoyl-CoA dioxygenase family)